MSVFFHNPETGTEQTAFRMQVTSNIERAEAYLRGIPGGAETALKKAVLSVRRLHGHFAEEALLKEYNVTKTMLHKKDGAHARITPKHRQIASSDGHGSVHEVLYSTHRIPLAEFVPNPKDERIPPARLIWKTTWAGHPAGLYRFPASVSPSVHVRRDTAAETVVRSFIARVHAGQSGFHTGMFERKEKGTQFIDIPSRNGTVRVINGDSAIEQKYAPSVSEMLANSKQARDYIDEAMSRSMDRTLDDKIRAILDGRIAI